LCLFYPVLSGFIRQRPFYAIIFRWSEEIFSGPPHRTHSGGIFAADIA
jgi:hypothetical protein